MKICSTCAMTFDNRFLFCPEDGTALQDTESNQTMLEPASPDPLPGSAEHLADLRPIVVCTACASEYPPMFSTCPLDGAPLVEPRAIIAAPARAATVDSPPVVPQVVARPPELPVEPELSEPHSPEAPETNVINRRPVIAPSLDWETSSQSSFNLAAAFTAGALIIAAGIAIVIIVSSWHRRPAAQQREAQQPAATQAAAPLQAEVYVPTPAAALDYVEPVAEPQETVPAPMDKAATAERENEQSARRQVTGLSLNRSGVTDAARPSARAVPASPAPLPSPPEPREQRSLQRYRPEPSVAAFDAAGLLRSHLVRSEAVPRPGGLHYQLTFSLENQSTRQSYFRSLTIQTHSSTGISRTQSLPFSHRLGPSGNLTFTIGVDMPGRSPLDLAGHVSMRVSGSDADGRPLDARFGAPLRP